MDDSGTREVTRQELYELVWQTPLRRLAATFGVSDVALAKVCRKLNVPVPGRGEWAKAAGGKPLRRRSLPPTAKQQVATIRRTPPKPEPTPEQVSVREDTINRVGKVEIPSAIARPHPLTTKTRKHFEDVRRRVARHAKRRLDAPWVPGDWPPREDHGRYCCAGTEGYRLTVSFTALERALGILDTVTKALSGHGFKFDAIESDQRGYYQRGLSGLVASKDGEQFQYFLREGYSSRERPAKELIAANNEGRYVTKYETLPNGSFTLEFLGSEHGVSEVFRDGKRTTLESELSRVVAVILDAVPRQKELRARREAEERARQEAERRRWLEQERIRKEKEQLEKLLDEAERAERFTTLRGYLERIERASLRGGKVSDSTREWLKEARRLAENYDPAEARLGHTRPMLVDDSEEDAPDS